MQSINDIETFEEIFITKASSQLNNEQLVQRFINEARQLFSDKLEYKIFLNKINSERNISYQRTKAILITTIQENSTEDTLYWTSKSYRKSSEYPKKNDQVKGNSKNKNNYWRKKGNGKDAKRRPQAHQLDEENTKEEEDDDNTEGFIV